MRNLVDKPMKLEDALAKFGSLLKHTRAFYVLMPSLEQGEVFKFGVAGISTGNAYNRINEYRINYGEFDSKNGCKGVMLYYLGITEYNRLVLAERSQVFQIELKLKQKYKSTTEERAGGATNRGTGFRAEGRGSERLKTSKVSIESFITEVKKLNREVEETPEEITRDARDTTQRYRTDTRSYIDSKTQAEQVTKETPTRPVTRSRGNFNVTTLPTTPSPDVAAPTPRVTRSRARNFSTTTLG